VGVACEVAVPGFKEVNVMLRHCGRDDSGFRSGIQQRPEVEFGLSITEKFRKRMFIFDGR
jgi:hypothetical protein